MTLHLQQRFDGLSYALIMLCLNGTIRFRQSRRRGPDQREARRTHRLTLAAVGNRVGRRQLQQFSQDPRIGAKRRQIHPYLARGNVEQPPG